MRSDGRKLVLFRDGRLGRYVIHLYGGACFIGDPTAYIIVNGNIVWIKPGESVEFVEVR